MSMFIKPGEVVEHRCARNDAGFHRPHREGRDLNRSLENLMTFPFVRASSGAAR